MTDLECTCTGRRRMCPYCSMRLNVTVALAEAEDEIGEIEWPDERSTR